MADAVLREDGFYVLREDGSKVLLETSTGGTAFSPVMVILAGTLSVLVLLVVTGYL